MRIAAMKIPTRLYEEQKQHWPVGGRHILAQFDESSVVVYQAYQPVTGHFAASRGYFGGEWSFNRMSWIKPNFLWMMFRSGWGTKGGQEVTLAVRIKRDFFDRVLEQAVPSSFDADLYSGEVAWKSALTASSARLQWDPDHSPCGASLPRRAIQLGLRNEALKEYARDAIVEIEDVSDFVAQQRANAIPENYRRLLTPKERVYFPANSAIATRLKLSAPDN